MEESDLDLIVSGSKTAVLMIEGFAREMPEDLMVEAIAECQRIIREICDLQEELFAKVGVQKPALRPGSAEHGLRPAQGALLRRVQGRPSRPKASKPEPRPSRRSRKRWSAEMIPDPDAPRRSISPASGRFDNAWHHLEERVVRDLILSGSTRPTAATTKRCGRSNAMSTCCRAFTARPIFQRGETQALITVTLGTPRDEQRVDGLIEEYSKKFMLDYYFPPFSVGETKPIRGPGRREIGHGALAERSIKPVLPDPDEFPYTIRVISDILESNGSSSMASVCGGDARADGRRRADLAIRWPASRSGW